jgi:Tol biopolymer transport system component
MKRLIIIQLAVFFQIAFVNISISWGFTPKIDYKEVLTPIFEKNARATPWLVNSADGSTLSFRTEMEDGNAYNDRLYVMNTDGTNLKDLTSKLLVTDLGPMEVWRLYNLQLNKSGSRLFFRAQFNAGTRIYIFDIDKGEFLPFFIELEGPFDERKSFGINAKGNRIYYRDFVYLDATSRPGLYKCTVPDNLIEPQGCIQYLNIDQLPRGAEIGIGPLSFLGHAIDADRTLFTWTNAIFPRSLWVIDDTGLYPGPINFAPKKVTSDFQWMWITANFQNEIISAEGKHALALINDPLFGQVPKLFAVDLESESEKPTLFKLLAEDASQLTWATISPSGRYARFTCRDHTFTRYNLQTDEMRDTISNLNGFAIQQASSITEDDRYYFISTRTWDPRGFDVVQIYRVDMAPTDLSNAPNITDINFINRGITSDGNTNITITASVSDAQGDNTIEWVKLMGLLNGIERFGNSTGPFNFSAPFNDAGIDGDVTAGDGIYTNASVVAVKEYFQDIAKPIKIGIRIIAKDNEGYYTIVDSVIKESKGIREEQAMSWIPLLLLND